MGSMVGYAVTVKINPGKIEDLEDEVKKGNKGMWSFMATLPTHIPKVRPDHCQLFVYFNLILNIH